MSTSFRAPTVNFLASAWPFDCHARRNLDLDISSDKLDVCVRSGKQTLDRSGSV